MLKIIIIIFITKHVKSETFTIGYLTGSQRKPGDQEYSRPGLTISGAISLAVEEVNQGVLQQRGHRLDFLIAETFGEEIASVRRTAELWTRNVSVYIGPQETCKHEAYIAAAFNLPMISYVILLYLKSPDFEFGNVALTVVQSLTTAGLTVIAARHWSAPYHLGYMENPFHKLVEDTYQDGRIYVIVGHYFEHLALMIVMEEKGLFQNGEYFVVGVDIEQYDQDNPTKYLRDFLREDEINPVAQKAYQSYLGVLPSSPVGFKNFTVLVNSYMERPPFNFPNPLNWFGVGKMIRAEAAYLYDAVHLYSRALIHILDCGGDPRDGKAIIDSIKQTHYKSAMGYIVYMDENGDAGGNYTLIARKPLKNRCDEYGLFPIGVFSLHGSNSGLPMLDISDSIEWVSGKPPAAVPVCGFRGEYCISNTFEITCGVAGGILSIVAIGLWILYRNWRYEQELDSLLWKVDYREIQLKESSNNNSIENKSNSISCPYVRTSQVSLSSNTDAEFRYSNLFTEVGIYRGRVLALKRVSKKYIDITREMKKELKLMRDLHHDNLNNFVGACTETPNVLILTEYCTRGSLKDILENEDVKLDSMFIASLVEDILRGMIYLHDSPIRFHGALHTGNCLVDSRWVVKLADFGLREFKKGEEDAAINDPSKIMEKCRKLLYRAPELLRSTELYLTGNFTSGTQKGDVYSFGIVLYEMHGRQGPFGDIGISYPEILRRVISPSHAPFRPPLDCLENTIDAVRDCLKDCWAESPEERPDFKSLRTKLRPLRKGMKPNIFDNMMAMMEKYANNLEALVDERTDQLQEEKKKTDALLYEMLPRPVAEQLKRGNKVEAEGFESVTIYFSDIVGFTAMSAESTPLEVVDFLNDLYTCFDSIIGNYDVYKVETIGDAYMVVSGLPIRNGYQHAGEVATMSLHLLCTVRNFTIRHRPGEKLLLRIGIHSGPVCAGVVGLKMPRYCLFGDTVNTASRMESTGLPLKIHCSQQSMSLLKKLGGYHLVERGEVPMKGKGTQQTYWLISEDPAMREIRRFERENRRRAGDAICRLLPKSSLKQKTGIIKSPISRCSSFESPKKLRFASEGFDAQRKRKTLEVIVDDSPYKKSATSLIENSLEPHQALKACSSSCPCIENLASSTVLLAQSHLSMFLKDDRAAQLTCQSVPTLYRNLNMPYNPILQVISAPASPKTKKSFDGWCDYREMFQWQDSTPLLKITRADSCNSDV